MGRNSSHVWERIKEDFLHSEIERGYSTGEMTTDEFYKTMKQRFKLNISKDEFVKSYSSIFQPKPEVMRLIKKLKRDYRLQLYSDTCPILYKNVIKKSPVYYLFEAETISHEVGAIKTSKDGYIDFIEKSEHSPKEIAFIDDIKEYVETARSLGVHAVHYKGPEKLKTDLRNLGIRL